MQKRVPVNLSSWEKPRKLDAAKINTFTVYCQDRCYSDHSYPCPCPRYIVKISAIVTIITCPCPRYIVKIRAIVTILILVHVVGILSR
jgi:hypothetical protein